MFAEKNEKPIIVHVVLYCTYCTQYSAVFVLGIMIEE